MDDPKYSGYHVAVSHGTFNKKHVASVAGIAHKHGGTNLGVDAHGLRRYHFHAAEHAHAAAHEIASEHAKHHDVSSVHVEKRGGRPKPFSASPHHVEAYHTFGKQYGQGTHDHRVAQRAGGAANPGHMHGKINLHLKHEGVEAAIHALVRRPR